jgi:cytochrome c553
VAAGLRQGRSALAAALFISATALAQDRLALCAGCHGPDGNSQTAGIPSIAGQPRVFLENQLIILREGLRVLPQMQEAVEGLTDKEIVALARHFAAQSVRPAAADARDPAQVERGVALAKTLHCGSCHLPDFRGREQMPRLAGQREEYLVESMLAYRDNRRTGGDTIMAAALYGVSDSDIRALAHYLARLK